MGNFTKLYIHKYNLKCRTSYKLAIDMMLRVCLLVILKNIYNIFNAWKIKNFNDAFDSNLKKCF